jgi:hypothetical protein
MVDFLVADMMKAEEGRGARATAGGEGEGGAVGGGAGAAAEEEFRGAGIVEGQDRGFFLDRGVFGVAAMLE